MPMVTSETILSEIEEFAERFIGKDEDFKVFHTEKIINDSVWGTQRFHNFELSVISLPIVQRLRQIRQMGFVNYVYPSAMHTRFEHTIGTSILIDKLFNYAKKEREGFLGETDLVHARLAALLHDIGHCLFSHASEELYGNMLQDMISDMLSQGDPKPHEFLTYLLVRSDAFKRFFSFLSRKYRMSVDANKIAKHIIGVSDNEKHRYKVSLINGAFDADKIDYIYRDSKFSGIPLLLDLDRLLHEIEVSDFNEATEPEDVQDLTIGISGVSGLEQIVFNKMLLFSTVYHHQKVKAFDCMFQSVFEYINQNNICLKYKDKELSFELPTDFLWFTDTEFMATGLHIDDELHRLIHNVLYRRPLKRAVVINRKTVEDCDNLADILYTTVNKAERKKELRELANNIWEDAGKPCSKHDVWIDMPKPPNFEEAISTHVRTDRTNPDTGLERLSEFFPINPWTEQYKAHKLKGHVFAPEDCVDKIAKSAKKIFEERSNPINLKPEAFAFCKLSPPADS